MYRTVNINYFNENLTDSVWRKCAMWLNMPSIVIISILRIIRYNLVSALSVPCVLESYNCPFQNYYYSSLFLSSLFQSNSENTFIVKCSYSAAVWLNKNVKWTRWWTNSRNSVIQKFKDWLLSCYICINFSPVEWIGSSSATLAFTNELQQMFRISQHFGKHCSCQLLGWRCSGRAYW